MIPQLNHILPDARVEGYYRLRKYKAVTGELVQDTGEFKNLITDQGFTRWTANPFVSYALVGTGTTAPAYTDVALAIFLGYSNTIQANTQSNPVYPGTDYAAHSITYRFAPGAATGNLTEVGVGYSSSGVPTSGTNRVCSRALIVDGGGSPITLTVLSDEYLDLTYTMRLYVPMAAADQSYNVVISGITYAVVARASNIASWTLNIQNVVGANLLSNGGVYSTGATLGAVTTTPSGGTSAGISTATVGITNTSSAGVITRSFAVTCALALGNVSGGIKCMYIGLSSASQTTAYAQYSFTPVIPKDATKIMVLNFSNTITRL